MNSGVSGDYIDLMRSPLITLSTTIQANVDSFLHFRYLR